MLRILLRVNKQSFTSLLNIYEKTIKQQNMNRDQSQIQVISQLQRLHNEIMGTHHSWKKYADLLQEDSRKQYHVAPPQEQKQQRKKGFFNFFSRQFSTARSVRVKGLYLFGGSGSGKSFLSDIFYQNLAIQEKKKIHFHQFMASIHGELFLLQKEKKGFDPLSIVAQRNAKKTRLLYLDEFQVTDVADASILRRLFEKLINNQLILLATTNRPPQDLYKDGHQRQFFLPFIDFLNEQCVVKKINSEKDYRYELLRDQSDKFKTYINPISQQSEASLKKVLSALTGQTNPYFSQKTVEPIPGRKLIVPRTCNNVCVYKFNELMESTMGDYDFRAISKNFKAIIIRDMRKIGTNERNVANRLIKLFDQAYFRNVKIYIEATVDIQELITPVAQKLAANEEDFAMIRCKSRLMQFQTINYKQKLSYIEEQAQISKKSSKPAVTQEKKNEQEKKS